VFLVAPAAPTNLTATPAAASVSTPTVTLTWTNNSTNPAATNFLIQRATNANFTGPSLVSMNATGAALTSYVDRTVAASTRYYWRVRAENTLGYSTWSNTATAISPAWTVRAPAGLTVTGRTRTSIALRWTRPAGGAPWVTLQVQRSATSATAGWNITRVMTSPNVTSYNWTGLTLRNHRYWFRVIAVSASGATATSAVVSALTLP
jgi:hypothetical protein